LAATGLILLDTNLLIYAYAPGSRHNKVARAWLEDVLRRPAKVGLPWPTLLGFMRLMANPHAVQRPAPLHRSLARVESWLALPQTWIPLPTDRHQEIFAGLLEGESQPNLVNDAHLATLAIEHGLTLCSADGDFARFRDLRWENPLRASRSR
jgi:toxin-antitoxin system PIN domain toxin